MNEVPQSPAHRLSYNVAMNFYNAIKDISTLYPILRLIQDEIDESKQRFRCRITVTQPLTPGQEAEFRNQILHLIETGILPELEGFQSDLDDIIFVTQSEKSLSHQAATGVCREVESIFIRDEIHVVYEDGIFVVYGAAPRDCNAIRTEIIMRIPHTIRCIVQFKSEAEWEEYQRSYRRIIDMYPDDIANAQVWKNTGSRVFKVHIGLYKPVSEEKKQTMKRAIIDFVTSTFLPTLPGFSLPEEHVSFFLSEDKNVADTVRRANASFTGMDLPSRPGLFSGVGLLWGRLGDYFEERIGTK